MKKKMYILYVPGCHLAYESITAATNILTLLTKGIPIKHDSQYRDYEISDDEDNRTSHPSLEVGLVDAPTKKKPLGLPAPKRNTVPCPFCEAVDVPRGSNCKSCGEYVS